MGRRAPAEGVPSWRPGDEVGSLYRACWDHEEQMHLRYDGIAGRRRPPFLRDAFRRGEAVVVGAAHFPAGTLPWRSGGKFYVLRPDDSFREAVYGVDRGPGL